MSRLISLTIAIQPSSFVFSWSTSKYPWSTLYSFTSFILGLNSALVSGAAVSGLNFLLFPLSISFRLNIPLSTPLLLHLPQNPRSKSARENWAQFSDSYEDTKDFDTYHYGCCLILQNYFAYHMIYLKFLIFICSISTYWKF